MDTQCGTTIRVAAASTTRGVILGGAAFISPGAFNEIQYVTIATAGNATDFGDALEPKWANAGCSSSTRAVYAGGNAGRPFATQSTISYLNVIEYITIATTGNSTDFGDLLGVRAQLGGCSSKIRGAFAGGSDGSGNQNEIAYITIDTTGNATDFGDLTLARRTLAGCSNSHGGI